MLPGGAGTMGFGLIIMKALSDGGFFSSSTVRAFPRVGARLLIVGLLLSSCAFEEYSYTPAGGRPYVSVIEGTIEDDTGCASYTENGLSRTGFVDNSLGEDAIACVYNRDFVDFDNALYASITLSAAVDRHIFVGSLVVGPTASSRARLAAMGISQGGDGPILTVEAGANVVFRDPRSFMLVNRGSQLIVNGSKDKPVSFTSISDPELGGASSAEDDQLWGGLIINGFGVTNSCSYSGVRGQDGFVANGAYGCHVQSEGLKGGQASYYGGDNDGDSSGSLRYLVVKHAGAEVEDDNELNGVTFNAVGSGTVVENLQVFRAFDDGIEFFGGAVNVSNYLALYVDDDSIDIDAGYIGTIERALVIQDESDGNRCIEADGVASYSGSTSGQIADRIARGLNSAPTLRNITCIISANEGPDAVLGVAGTHDPGEGVRLREGIHATLSGVIVTNAYTATSSQRLALSANNINDNWCLDIDNIETLAAAADGNLTIENSIFACSLAVDSDNDIIGAAPNEMAWLIEQPGVDAINLDPLLSPASTSDAALAIFAGSSYTPLATDAIALPSGQISKAPQATVAIGHLAGSDTDWTEGWTIGLDDLWFDPAQEGDSADDGASVR